MNRIPLIFRMASFFLATLLSVGAAVVLTSIVERRSIEAVETALVLGWMDWVVVSANGLQVILEGTAPDEAENFRAVTRAGTIVNATRIVNRMQVLDTSIATPPRFSLDMLRNEDGIQLIGLVPSSSDSVAIVDSAENIANDVVVTDMVETANFPMPQTWETALAYGLRALRTLPRSKVTVYEDRVEVQAISESASERAALLSRLARGQPRGVEVILDISAPRPVITPFTFRFVLDEGRGRLETCAADTAEARSRILAAARAAGAVGDVSCSIGLGVPSPQWGDAVVLAVAAVANIGAGSVTFTDADVALMGDHSIRQDIFDRAVGELDAALPDVFSLQGILPRPDPTTGQGPAQFLATLDLEGQLYLRGRVPQGPVGESIHAYAISLFGIEDTDVATRSVPDLPLAWGTRTMAGLDALALLHDGSLVVEPDQITISGRTGNTGVSSNVARLLAENLGPTGGYELDVTYVEALDPIASMPTPEECVARIQAVQAETKITFDTGSITINEQTGRVLDQIAEILPLCRHARMEISGHTDSQGGENMNLDLSQARANAVLDGFLARDVLVSNLTAQGYGESQPIASNTTEEGREQNRRIEFRLLTPVSVGQQVVDNTAPIDVVENTLPEMRPVPRPENIADRTTAN